MTPHDAPVLSDADLAVIGYTDKGRRYFPRSNYGTYRNPAWEYVKAGGYRYPSSKHPHSYYEALRTRKFARWARKHHPVWAEDIGLFPKDPTQRTLLELLEATE